MYPYTVFVEMHGVTGKRSRVHLVLLLLLTIVSLFVYFLYLHSQALPVFQCLGGPGHRGKAILFAPPSLLTLSLDFFYLQYCILVIDGIFLAPSPVYLRIEAN